jgi:hypothetical protein
VEKVDAYVDIVIRNIKAKTFRAVTLVVSVENFFSLWQREPGSFVAAVSISTLIMIQ